MNLNTTNAASLHSQKAFAGEDFEPEEMDKAENCLCNSIESGGWNNKTFDETIAGQIAAEVRDNVIGKSLEDLTTDDKINLIQRASEFGKEYFVDTIISLLPPEIRVVAALEYDCCCSIY